MTTPVLTPPAMAPTFIPVPCEEASGVLALEDEVVEVEVEECYRKIIFKQYVPKDSNKRVQ